MGKLGKKARKFAKKNLQSVLKNRRKSKPVFKKRASSKKGKNEIEKEHVDKQVGPTTIARITEEYEGVGNISLDAVFVENDKDDIGDASDSDGYLSEDSSCPYVAESENGGKNLEDEITTSTYSAQNEKILADLALQKKELARLTKKDPEFSTFLERFNNSAETVRDEDEYSDEGSSSDEGEQGEEDMAKDNGKLLTNSVINTWGRMVKEDNSQSAFTSLLNAYRAACHYGSESIGHKIDSSETFCNILLFTLSNADDVFRGLLQISSVNSKEALVELKKIPKWISLKPLVKSYVRSTLFLLNQVTDTDILAFAMTRIRASLIFFLAFPSLMQRLIKAAVNLWATGERVLSSASFLITRDVAAMFSSTYFNMCLSKTFVAIISRSRVTEITDINHMQFLRDCFVELCSLDVEKSSLKATASINQLAKILSWGVKTKKKEAVKKMCSWEYVNCIDLWVRFMSANVRDYDLRALFFMTIQLVNGLAHMFPGPRYFPLRLKCIGWLNYLSSSSGTFIPVVSMVLDMLEYKVAKVGKRSRTAFNIASVVKLPKHYLKLRNFQDDCFNSAVEQLSLHFAQWSYHISFPDLATISLIRLRKIHEVTTTESLRRMLKRLIDQVERNVEFVQRKRDEVSFSPHEHPSVDSFLQHEKSSLNAPFTQYYRSVLEKAADRSVPKCGKISSLPEQRNLKRNRAEPKREIVAAGLRVDAEEDRPAVENGTIDTKQKKKRVLKV